MTNTIPSMSQYAKHKDGTYVSFEMSNDSRQSLDNFVERSLGLTERVDPNTYHITVIYSRYPVPHAENLPRETTAVAFCDGYEIFPTKNDGKCLVMRVQCAEATNLNTHLTGLGATSDYDKYKAHITLAYDIKQDIDPDSLPVPQFPLYFDTLNVAPLDPEFTPANK